MISQRRDRGKVHEAKGEGRKFLVERQRRRGEVLKKDKGPKPEEGNFRTSARARLFVSLPRRQPKGDEGEATQATHRTAVSAEAAAECESKIKGKRTREDGWRRRSREKGRGRGGGSGEGGKAACG